MPGLALSFDLADLPGVTKVPCFLELFKYSRSFKKHPFETPGNYFCYFGPFLVTQKAPRLGMIKEST